MTIDAGNVHT